MQEAQLEEKDRVQCRMTNQLAKEQTGYVLQQLVDALRQVTKGPSRPWYSPRPRRRRTSLTRVTWSAGSARRGATGGESVLSEGVILLRLKFSQLGNEQGEKSASNFEAHKNIFKTGSIYSVAHCFRYCQWEDL